MQHLLVSSSIIAAPALRDIIVSNYNLSAVTSCRLIKAGINHSYLVSHKEERFIFRVYSFAWRTEKEILEELRLLNHLRQDNISVSYPIRDKRGSYLQLLPAPEGDRFAVLFSYADGDKLLNFPEETHFAIGEMMGRMHIATNHLQLDRVHYNVDVLLVNPFAKLKEYLPTHTQEMRYMLMLQQRLIKAFAEINYDQLRPGAVHLDIWFDNLHVDSNNKVTLFDFDFCGNGWLCMDVAYYLLQLQVLEPDVKTYKAKADQFIKGYETICEMSSEEKRVLPILGLSIYFFYLGIQCERFENWSNVFINETYLKRFIEVRIKKYAEYHHL